MAISWQEACTSNETWTWPRLYQPEAQSSNAPYLINQYSLLIFPACTSFIYSKNGLLMYDTFVTFSLLGIRLYNIYLTFTLLCEAKMQPLFVFKVSSYHRSAFQSCKSAIQGKRTAYANFTSKQILPFWLCTWTKWAYTAIWHCTAVGHSVPTCQLPLVVAFWSKGTVIFDSTDLIIMTYWFHVIFLTA